jgi:hypothetical protein
VDPCDSETLRYLGPRVLDVPDVLNLTNSRDHDIDYLYASRLAGEGAPVEDLHYHVMEPRTARVSVS